MREIWEKAITAVKVTAAAAIALYCAAAPERAGAAAASGIVRCITVVIPSLYAMMIAAPFLIRSGIVGTLGRLLELPARLLGLSGSELGIFLFSQIAGYPTGIRMLSARISHGSSDSRRAALLSGVCFGAGPAFISGCIAAQLYGSPDAGRLVLISTISANAVLLMAMSFVLRRSRGDTPEKQRIVLTAELLTECVSDGGRAMAEICFAVVGFAVFTAALRDFGVISLIAGIVSRLCGADQSQTGAAIAAFIDITAAAGLPRGEYLLLPVVSGLVSFGGICVFFQLSTMTGGRIRLLPVFLMRLAAGVLSGVICRLIMPPLMGEEIAAAAAIQSAVYRAQSPVPSVLLVIMTVIVIKNAGGIGRTSGRENGVSYSSRRA